LDDSLKIKGKCFIESKLARKYELDFNHDPFGIQIGFKANRLIWILLPQGLKSYGV